MRLLISILFTTIFAAPAFAGDFYVIDLGDAHMRSGQGQDTIKLKQKLKQQHHVDLRDAELLSVMMVAKTRKGSGKAHLVVGQNTTGKQVFGGTAANFKSTSDKTYDRHLFLNPKDNSKGRWQIKLKGNFMVRQMVVEIGTADEDLYLDYSHKHMRSGQGNDTLKLRTKAKNQHGIQTQDYDLHGITLIAKTRKGSGKARLKVGGELSTAQVVDGQASNFQDSSDWTYYKYEFDNPKENSNGVWQVKLKGNFKVSEVILHMTKK